MESRIALVKKPKPENKVVKTTTLISLNNVVSINTTTLDNVDNTNEYFVVFADESQDIFKGVFISYDGTTKQFVFEG